MYEVEENEDLMNLDFVKSQGYMNMEHFNEHKTHVRKGLQAFGGEFGRSLGLALFYADLQNSMRILSVWRNLCEQHAILWRAAEAKRKALKP